MKQLTIKLVGARGAGKTTMARLLSQCLRQCGFTVEDVEDKDINKRLYHLDACISSLKDRVVINIETVNPNIEKYGSLLKEDVHG